MNSSQQIKNLLMEQLIKKFTGSWTMNILHLRGNIFLKLDVEQVQ